jgi:hypothetical protein
VPRKKAKPRVSVIDARRSYGVDDMIRIGYGYKAMAAMRLEGVNARMAQGHLRFMGEEILDWERRQPVAPVKRKKEKEQVACAT